MKRRVICCLVFMLLLCFLIMSGCQNTKETNTNNESTATESETNPIESSEHETTVADPPAKDEKSNLITNFSVSAFKECYDENNTLISPVSIMYALTMTANGADGNTLTEMERALGNTTDKLNEQLKSFSEKLPQGDKFSTQIANSIWLKDSDSLSISENFLNTNKDYYGAEIYRAEFNKNTVDQINEWVNEKTKGMIKEIVNDLSQNTIMCLINTVAFEAEWTEAYDIYSVYEGNFTTANGETQLCDFMSSTEDYYIEDENSLGVIKYYSGMDYAFVGIIPKDSTSLSEYVSSLTGEKINKMLSNPQEGTVSAKIPKFETEYSVQANDFLKEMGINDAFNVSNADFTKIGTSDEGNIYISSVLHKTYISVAEKGTKAGAVTAVFLEAECSNPVNQKYVEVFLDRPFIYMIIECNTNSPLFIGCVNNVK